MKRIIIAALALVSFIAAGQQDPITSQYMINQNVINPAYINYDTKSNILVTHRNQYMGLDGAPRTSGLTVNSLINANMNVGLNIFNDVLGPLKNYGINGNYGYALETGPGKLSFGLQFGVSQYSVDWNDIKYKDLNDGLIAVSAEKKTIIDAGFGVYYKMDNLDVGLSVTHLPETSLRAKDYNVETHSKYFRHYYLYGKYNYDINSNVALKPSLLVRYMENGTLGLDVNVYSLFAQKYGIGVSYRTSKVAVFLVEMFISEKFALGFSYDYNLNKLQTLSNGSTEISVRFINPFSIFSEKGDITEPVEE